jgi:hypothetical protein
MENSGMADNSLGACGREVLGLAASRAVAYLQNVGSRRVAPSPSAVLDLAQFAEPLPEAPGDEFGVLDLLDRVGSPATVANARRFAEGLRAAGHEILNEVVINQVLVSFGEPAVTRDVIAKVQSEGTCWCGGTAWHGRAAMRISVSSWATTEEDVEMSLAAIVRIAEECRR